MTKNEATKLLQAVIDSLQHLSISATKENVAYLVGSYNILEEIKSNIGQLSDE